MQLVATEAGAANGAPGGVCCNSGGNSDGVHVDGTIWVPTSDGVLAVDLKRELRTAAEELAERRFDQVCRVLVHEERTDLVTLLLMPRRMALEERLRTAQRLGEVRADVDGCRSIR